MRIVHLTTVHHLEDPRIFWKECRTAASAGFDVTLLAQHDRDTWREGIHVRALERVEGRWRRIPLLLESFYKARQMNADLYHLHDPELIPVGWALKATTGAKIIYDMHEDYRWKGGVAGRAIRILEKWCFRWVDHVVVANEHEAAIPAGHGAPHTLVANYPCNTVNSPATERTRSDSLRLVYTGVIASVRGLDFMMDIAATVKQRDLPFEVDIAGICNYEDQRMQARARYLREDLAGVMTRPEWSSYVSPEELQARRLRADVGLLLLQPAGRHNQVYPTKLYEYLQAGLPVLATDQPLWREFVEQHDCGAVVEFGDVDGACRILQSWNDNPDEYQRISKNALSAAEQYRWDEMGARLLNVYNSLLTSTSG